jgi:hypothetical protein
MVVAITCISGCGSGIPRSDQPASTSVSTSTPSPVHAPSNAVLSSNRGSHALRVPVDLCSITAIKALVAKVYDASEDPVACGPSEVNVTGETPPLAEENWYFPTVPNSGNVGTGDGRVSIELFNDHTQYVASYWEQQQSFLHTHPTMVQTAQPLNGIPVLWENHDEFVTPYGQKVDLVVTVFANLSSESLPAAEEDAMRLAATVEKTAFQ